MTAPSMRSPLDRATWRLLRDRGGSPRAADIIERHHADVWHAAQAEVRAVLAALAEPTPGMVNVGLDQWKKWEGPASEMIAGIYRAMIAKAGEG